MYENAPKSIQITSTFEGPNLTTQMMDSFIPVHLKQRKTEEYHGNWAGWTAAMGRARVVCTCVMVSFFQQPPSLGQSGSVEIRGALGIYTIWVTSAEFRVSLGRAGLHAAAFCGYTAAPDIFPIEPPSDSLPDSIF